MIFYNNDDLDDAGISPPAFQVLLQLNLTFCKIEKTSLKSTY